MRECEDLGGAEEGGLMHGATVERLDDYVVFLGDSRVVDVDETVRRAGEENVGRLARVETELRDVVAVHLVIPQTLCWR